MTEDPFSGPGVTALGLAAARSVESGRPDRLIDDPYARGLFEAAASRPPMRVDWPGEGDEPTDAEKLHLHGSRYIGLRTRVYDDALEAAVAAGVRQAVLLGAGLDTRAQRLTLHSELDLYEVDAPAVLDFKRDALAAQGAVARCRLTPVGADLAGEWEAALVSAGFDAGTRTAWIGEGVLPYLTAQDQAELAATVTRLSAPGSSFAFDVVGGGDVAALSERSGMDMRSMLQGTGGAHELVALLERSGWGATSAGAETMARRYGRDLADPFAERDAGEPPWLDTVFVSAQEVRRRGDRLGRVGDQGEEGYDSGRLTLQMFTLAWAWNLLFPRLAYRLRWPTRLTGWPLAGYVALMAAQGMAIRQWVVPWFRRLGEEQRERRAELGADLGREPTDEEFFEWMKERDR